MYNYEVYRSSAQEQARIEDLSRLLPQGCASILDVGARDGFFARIFAGRFSQVTALDLTPPTFRIPGVLTLAADATKLPFGDNSFDCVFCAEVLEHIPDVAPACREIARVARRWIVIGVPYRQDTRIGRLTCRSCAKISPPWGHVNEFDEAKLRHLFSGLTVKTMSFVGENREATNALSTLLLDWAGNPWGTYDQEEGCIACGAKLVPPENRTLWQKLCSAAGVRLMKIQQAMFTRPHGNWVHIVFEKNDSA